MNSRGTRSRRGRWRSTASRSTGCGARPTRSAAACNHDDDDGGGESLNDDDSGGESLDGGREYPDDGSLHHQA